MLKEKNLAIHNSALIHCTLTAMDNIHYHCLRTTSTVELVLKFHNKTHIILYLMWLFCFILLSWIYIPVAYPTTPLCMCISLVHNLLFFTFNYFYCPLTLSPFKSFQLVLLPLTNYTISTAHSQTSGQYNTDYMMSNFSVLSLCILWASSLSTIALLQRQHPASMSYIHTGPLIQLPTHTFQFYFIFILLRKWYACMYPNTHMHCIYFLLYCIHIHIVFPLD